MDAFAIRSATTLRGWLLWPFLLSVAAGSGLWALRNQPKLAAIDTNKLTEPERLQVLMTVGATFAGLWFLVLFATAARRLASGVWRPLETAVALNKWLFIALAVPVVAALRVKDVETSSPKLTLFLIAIAAAASTVTFYQWPTLALSDPDPDASARAQRLAKVLRVLPPLGVAALWAGYGWFFTRLSITNHHGLVTRTTDLGYYDNIFYQSIHGHPLGCSFIKAGYHGSAHFDPILILLSPLYLLYPRAEFLLGLQSVWLGMGVIPTYLITKTKTGSRWAGLVLAALYAAYPALHGANMYEFHSLTLISPLVIWLLYFFEIGATKRYFAMLGLLLLCREDVSLLMCFVGLYEIFTRRQQGARMGWITIALSAAYFVVVKAFFMTSSGIFMTGKDAYSFAYYYESLIPNHTGINGLVISLLTNPIFALKTAFEEPKVIFLVLLFLPLALLPLFAKRGRVMLVYGLLFCLLASRAAVYSVAFQYSAVILPIAFATTPMALRQIASAESMPRLGFDARRVSRALLGAAFVATIFVSWKFGGLVDNGTFHGGFARIARSLTDDQKKTYAWVNETMAKVPRSASVGVTNRVGPHASNRLHVYFYPTPDSEKVDYVFLDEAELHGPELDKHNKDVSAKKLVEVSRHEHLALFKRAGVP